MGGASIKTPAQLGAREAGAAPAVPALGGGSYGFGRGFLTTDAVGSMLPQSGTLVMRGAGCAGWQLEGDLLGALWTTPGVREAGRDDDSFGFKAWPLLPLGDHT